MSDTGDDWAAYKEQQKQERAKRRDSAEQRLKNAGLQFTVHNGGAHIVITEGGAIFDYWPGTERWRMRDFKGQHGFDNLLAAIRQRRVVALDLSKIEERVIAQMVDAGKLVSKPFSGDPSTLRTLNVPPWQELPTGVNETLDHYGTLAYVDKMEKAYPHLSGPDEKP